MKAFIFVVTAVMLLFWAGCRQIQKTSNQEKIAAREMLIWPDGAPGAKGNRPGDKPTLTVYLPKEPDQFRTAVVVCPGGGYERLSMDYEGHEVAKWLSSIGMAGCVLKYRHAGDGYQHPAPLQDAKRAMRIVRSNAENWNINPDRIGIMGFSAGGHLAGTLGAHYDMGDPGASDAIERASCRPNFLVLCYAPLSFVENAPYSGAIERLCGPNPTRAALLELSPTSQVSSNTPPSFLVHCMTDKIVPVENSVKYYEACIEAGVGAELHLYQKGRHGFGMGVGNEPASSWTDLFETWVKRIDL